MSQNKYLVDILVSPGAPFAPWDETRRIKDKYLYRDNIQLHNRIDINHSCSTDIEAFALMLHLYARMSSLTDDVVLSQVEPAKKVSIKTGFGDKICVRYLSREIRMHYSAATRILAFRILLFLFKELRAINSIDITIREDIKRSLFALYIDDTECVVVKYNPDAEDFGTEIELRQIAGSILENGSPINADEIQAEREGISLCQVYYSIVSLPSAFAMLGDIDTNGFKAKQHIYVSTHTAKPIQLSKPTDSTSSKKKKKDKKHKQPSGTGAGNGSHGLSPKAMRKAQFKAIKTRNGSLPSFWDRIEMRGDHDD